MDGLNGRKYMEASITVCDSVFSGNEVCMKCANCGKEIRESDAFCPHCGEQLMNLDSQDRLSENRAAESDDMTFIGSYDSPDDPDIGDDRTWIDGGSEAGLRTGTYEDDRTRLDSGRVNGRYGDMEDDRTVLEPQYDRGLQEGSIPYTAPFPGVQDSGNRQNTQEPYPGTYGTGNAGQNSGGIPFYADGYSRQRPSSYGGYTSPVSGWQEPGTGTGTSTRPGTKTAIFIILIAVLLLAAAGTVFYLLKGRTPEVSAMTYDELITDYGLDHDDSDSIRSAYDEHVRIEFEDVTKSSSGYKATAVIYAPDMEEIYEKTTEEDSVVDRLERVTEDDLHRSRKAVLIEKEALELKQSSAEELKETIDSKYLTVDQYNAEIQENAADSDTPSSGSDSASSDAGSSSSSSGSTSAANPRGSYNAANAPSDSSDDRSSDSATSAPSNSGFVFSDSSSRYISSSELSGLSAWQCCIARNEIYARHGRMFNRNDLQSYFNNCTWYTPTVAASAFNENVLNSYERENVKTIKSYEQAHGYI